MISKIFEGEMLIRTLSIPLFKYFVKHSHFKSHRQKYLRSRGLILEIAKDISRHKDELENSEDYFWKLPRILFPDMNMGEL